MPYRLLSVIFVLIFAASVARSAEVMDATPGRIPAVMVWQVQSKDRMAYLVGELHVFEGYRDSDIDFAFGLALYDHAAQVYTEATHLLSIPTPPPEKLSRMLGPEMWRRVEVAISTNVPLLFGPNDRRAAAFAGTMQRELDGKTAVMADDILRDLSYVAHVDRTKKRPPLVIGLMNRLRKLDAAKGADAKIKTLEDDTVNDEVWRRRCNTRAFAQALIGSTLQLFEDEAPWNDDQRLAMQRLYIQGQATGDELMATWLASFAGSQIHLECNVIPRNEIWLEKINAILQTPGPSVMINVGVMHLFGDKGLLAQLSKSDGLVIRRIYSLPDK